MRIQVAFPLPRSEEIKHELVVSNLRELGFVRLLVDGVQVDISGPDADHPDDFVVDLTQAEELLVIVDRIKTDPDDTGHWVLSSVLSKEKERP